MSGVVYNNIPKLVELLRGEIIDIIQSEPKLMKNDITVAMNKPHTGRLYQRRSITHQASAPGEAPAIDTGALVNSIEVRQSSPLASSVQSNQPQALALELGRPEANLEPRPAWIPAAERSVRRINKRLKELRQKVENV